MPTYYRWIAQGENLQAAKRGTLQSSSSTKAYWIFDMTGSYRPSAGVHLDRVLVGIVFKPEGESILADQSKWIRFPRTEFLGEAKHPDGIIVKENEPGAFGIGQLVLQELNRLIKETRLASKKEMEKALGPSIPQSQIAARMRNQRW